MAWKVAKVATGSMELRVRMAEMADLVAMGSTAKPEKQARMGAPDATALLVKQDVMDATARLAKQEDPALLV